MKQNSNKHSKLSSSSSSRWIACPGSIKLCENVPEPPESPFALEGTQAHALAETCLKEWTDTKAYIGETISYTDRNNEVVSFVVSEEMAEHVQIYLDAIQILVSKEDIEAYKVFMGIERRLDLSWLHPDTGGTSDCYIYDIKNKKAYIFDLKYGQGIVVNPEWNTQQLIYALGTLHDIWSHQTEKTKKVISPISLVKEVEIVIVQPRAYHSEGAVRRWDISSEDLYHWGLQVLRPAAYETEKDNAMLRVGPHCRFCPALAVCPEQVRNACVVAKTEFDDPVLPAPHELSSNDVVKIMHISDIFSTWANEVKVYAQRLMETGTQLPGYKLVKRRSIRKWSDEAQAENELNSLLGEAAYEKKLLSPAKAEKLLKKNKLIDSLDFQDLVVKKDAGLVIAPDTDKRAAVAVAADIDFLEDADFFD